MNLLTRKLENFAPLGIDDKRFLDELVRKNRMFERGKDIILVGDAPDNVHLILDGFACRYKLTSNGERHIMAYLVPGDFRDLHIAILKEMDHSIGTLSPCQVVDIPSSVIENLTERPGLMRALWWATLVDEAILREWLVNIGQREAPQRLAHLFCELLLRLNAVELTTMEGFELPITQSELADTPGLSAVHVNRSLQMLRADGLIKLKDRNLLILDPHCLMEFSGFNPNYLHLFDRAGRHRGPGIVSLGLCRHLRRGGPATRPKRHVEHLGRLRRHAKAADRTGLHPQSPFWPPESRATGLDQSCRRTARSSAHGSLKLACAEDPLQAWDRPQVPVASDRHFLVKLAFAAP